MANKAKKVTDLRDKSIAELLKPKDHRLEEIMELNISFEEKSKMIREVRKDIQESISNV